MTVGDSHGEHDEHGHEEEEHTMNMMRLLLNNPTTATICVAGLILFSLGFEFTTHKLEHALAQSKYLTLALHHLYKELTILGLISFLFVIVDYFGWAHAVVDAVAKTEFDKEVFEIVHIMLFVVLAVYLFTCAFLMLLSTKFANDWSIMEAEGSELIREEHAVIQGHLQDNSCGGILQRPWFWYKRYHNNRKMDFYRLRTVFIRSNQLSRRFNFAKYLRSCNREMIVHLIHIPSSLWMILLFFMVCNVIRTKAIGAELRLRDDTVPIFISFGAFSMFIIAVVFTKLRRIEAGLFNSVIRRRSFGESVNRAAEAAVVNGSGHFTSPPVHSDDGNGEAVHGSGGGHGSGFGSGHGSGNISGGHGRGNDHGHGEHGHGGHGHGGHGHGHGSGGCCSFFSNYKNATTHERLFWLRSETFMLRLIQLAILFQSFYIAAFIMGLSTMVGSFGYYWTGNLGGSWALIGVSVAPSIFVLLVFTPLVLPIYTLVTSVGQKSKHDIILMVNERLAATGQYVETRDLDEDGISPGENEPTRPLVP